MGYSYDIRLERRFANQIKAALGCLFIGQDPQHDVQQGTDFEIFTITPFRVAARLRRHCYLARYKNEFTIRWTRPSGVLTEIDKIRSGFVDYLFYGFVDKQEKRLVQYFVGDLRLFRAKEPKPIGIFPNDPFDSELAAYALSDMPRRFLLKTWKKPEG